MRSIPPITKRVGAFQIAIPSLELREGEILGVFGHSGSGKSTYLRAVSDYVGFPAAMLMHQEDALLDYLSARQNIELGIRAAGVVGSTANRRVTELSEALELRDLLDRRVTALSGGQRRRVYLAQALGIDSPLLLLDEPFTGLGWKYERMACSILQRRRDEGRETIIVSHDLPFLSEMASKIILINDGLFAGTVSPSEPEPTESSALWAETIGVTNIIEVATLGRVFELPEEFARPRSERIAFWRAWIATYEPQHSDDGSGILLRPKVNVRSKSRLTSSGGEMGCIIRYFVADEIILELQVSVSGASNVESLELNRFMWLSET
jgi:NitT/TauT family transport system ATP-binding protein